MSILGASFGASSVETSGESKTGLTGLTASTSAGFVLVASG